MPWQAQRAYWLELHCLSMRQLNVHIFACGLCVHRNVETACWCFIGPIDDSMVTISHSDLATKYLHKPCPGILIHKNASTARILILVGLACLGLTMMFATGMALALSSWSLRFIAPLFCLQIAGHFRHGRSILRVFWIHTVWPSEFHALAHRNIVLGPNPALLLLRTSGSSSRRDSKYGPVRANVLAKLRDLHRDIYC